MRLGRDVQSDDIRTENGPAGAAETEEAMNTTIVGINNAV
jgi:hypothetical protein